MKETHSLTTKRRDSSQTRQKIKRLHHRICSIRIRAKMPSSSSKVELRQSPPKPTTLTLNRWDLLRSNPTPMLLQHSTLKSSSSTEILPTQNSTTRAIASSDLPRIKKTARTADRVARASKTLLKETRRSCNEEPEAQ
jgi:hypothetical protein